LGFSWESEEHDCDCKLKRGSSHGKFGDGLRINPIALGQRSQARLTMRYRSRDRRCRCGASLENLAHSASFEALDMSVPSNRGIKHLRISCLARSAKALHIWASVRDPSPGLKAIGGAGSGAAPLCRRATRTHADLRAECERFLADPCSRQDRDNAQRLVAAPRVGLKSFLTHELLLRRQARSLRPLQTP